MMDVSSTFIREAIRAGHDVRFFLPEGVGRYVPEIARRLAVMR